MEEYEERMNSILVSSESIRSSRDLLRRSLESKNNAIAESEKKQVCYAKILGLLKTWLDELIDENIESIGNLVTSGLNHIVDDQDLVFSIKQEQKPSGVSIKFSLKQGEVEGDPIDSFGGGVVMVASLILRLAIMSRLNMGKLLILDEPLNALASKYVPNCAEFIRQLSENLGINILMVTHNPEFASYAHTSYVCEDIPPKDGIGEHELSIRRV